MITIKEATLLIPAGTPERAEAGRHPWNELGKFLSLPRVEGCSWRIHGFQQQLDDSVELYAEAVVDPPAEKGPTE